MRDPMLDKNFLRELDHYKHKFIWVKLIALNWKEEQTEEITGIITTGSINVDGDSRVRRTCNLSLVAKDVNINNFYWSLNTKFKVEIGLENWINPEFPDIIWFKQGVYIISSFSCNQGTNNYTISIQGKDKMSMLNGDIGGVVPYPWDFGKIDITNEDGTITREYYPIKEIILHAVHEYAQEGWQNIIVNDLDDYGLELLEYDGLSPLYYIISSPDSGDNSREVENMTLNGDMPCWVREDSWENGKRKIGTSYLVTTISQVEDVSFTADTGATGALCYEKLMEKLDPSGNVTETKEYLKAYVALEEPVAGETPNLYTIAKITRDNGMQVCGYRICDIVYPYELAASPGDTIISVFDKLVEMLGNFEYFYDVNGRFIFQKKRTYLDVSYNNIINEHSINDSVWADSKELVSQFSYVFNKDELISSVQNSPNLANLKNDYSLWGRRKSGETDIPIHMRYAIDHKPKFYKVIGHHIKRDIEGNALDEEGNIIPLNEDGTKIKEGYSYFYDDVGDVYVTEEGIEEWVRLREEFNKNNPNNKQVVTDISEAGENIFIVDWREIIFQMANDYRRHYRSNNFLTMVRDNNKYSDYDSFYPKGYTGYEEYYVDFEMNLSQGVLAYWRELYNPKAINEEGLTVSGYYTKKGDFITSTTEWNTNINTLIDEIKLLEKTLQQDVIDASGSITQSMIDAMNVQLENKRTELNEIAYGLNDVVLYDGSLYKSLIDNNTTEPTTNNNKWEKLDLFYMTYNADGWNPDILNNPEMLNFWFDFLDTTGNLNKYSVQNIGQRTKAANDDKIKAIYYRETPNVIFYTSDKEKTDQIKHNWVKPGYCHLHIPAGLMGLFSISSRGKNAMDVVEEYLYSYTYPASAVTISTVPIYYLIPNTLIYLDDPETGAVGAYIMTKFSLQLGANGSMNINAIETATRIY